MLALEQVRSVHLGKGGWVGDAREGRSLVRRQCMRVSWMGWMMLVMVVVRVGMLQVHTALLHAVVLIVNPTRPACFPSTLARARSQGQGRLNRARRVVACMRVDGLSMGLLVVGEARHGSRMGR
jgi:hypothetical protein